MMDAKKLLEQHKIPCGPMSVTVDGTCRRKLQDHFNQLLDRLTRETHPENVDPGLMDETVMEGDGEQEMKESPEQMKERLIEEGKIRADAQKEIDAYRKSIMRGDEDAEEETPEEKKRRMIEEGKMKVDVKKEVDKYQETVMNDGKKKEPEETEDQKKQRMIKEGKLHNEVKKAVKTHEERIMGNSKMSQDISGKIKKR